MLLIPIQVFFWDHCEAGIFCIEKWTLHSVHTLLTGLLKWHIHIADTQHIIMDMRSSVCWLCGPTNVSKADPALGNRLSTQILKLPIRSEYVVDIVLSMYMNALTNSQDNLVRRKNLSIWTISKHIVDCSIKVKSTAECVLCYRFTVHSDVKETTSINPIMSKIVGSQWLTIKANFCFFSGNANLTFALPLQCRFLTKSLIMIFNTWQETDGDLPKIMHRC